MRRWARESGVLVVIIAIVVGGCAPAGPPSQAGSGSGAASQRAPAAGPKRVTASIMGEPASLVARANSTQISPPGAAVLEQLVNASLAEVNRSGELQPLLAE